MGTMDEGALHRTNTKKSLGSDDTWFSLSAFLKGEYGAYSESSESLLGFSTSLFNDASSSVIDKEDPSEYIPAPAENSAVCKFGMDEKLLEAWRLVYHDVKVQDSLVCLQGKDKLLAWLQTLAAANAQLNLLDIYAERIATQPGKDCIYAIWTLSIPGKLQSTANPSIFEGEESFQRELSLSGESKFDIDGTGQVVSVVSKWYVPSGGEEKLELAKKCLISLLHKHMHNS
ncbi:hypothetical protein GOP47_0015558 [Adiantum capillus-veneris]|uniref:Uncharacterized protein n=1 Tax=Adiantum capillus-veneris TaxID=13818 RepID=A0A9D4UK85_ADICA|nr:hypothetical protein GOP47_0015558 [Adiantum capillus-veneris]